MDRAERILRWQSLMAGVERADVLAWRETFVDALREVERPRRGGRTGA
jgi:trehalose-6-phosphate synthase